MMSSAAPVRTRKLATRAPSANCTPDTKHVVASGCRCISITFLVYSRDRRTLALLRRMNGRLIAIGDIHGCHVEFAELLARLDLTRDDRLVLLGDLINRGPDSNKVIELARENRAVALLGNHELRFLKHRRTGDKKFV